MGTAIETRVNRLKPIPAVFMQGAFDPITMRQQVKMRDGLSEGHHHLTRVEVLAEKHGQ